MKTKIVLITACVGGAAFFGVMHHRYVNLDPKDSQSLCSDPILSSKQIKIPGYPKAYNPSIIEI